MCDKLSPGTIQDKVGKISTIWGLLKTFISKVLNHGQPTRHNRYKFRTDLLQTAGTPAGDASEGPDETDDLPVHVVLDRHVEAAQRAAAVPGAAVVLLLGLVDLLAQTVFDLVLVVRLKPNESCGRAGSRDVKILQIKVLKVLI